MNVQYLWIRQRTELIIILKHLNDCMVYVRDGSLSERGSTVDVVNKDMDSVSHPLYIGRGAYRWSGKEGFYTDRSSKLLKWKTLERRRPDLFL
jgi:hypothetical protein